MKETQRSKLYSDLMQILLKCATLWPIFHWWNVFIFIHHTCIHCDIFFSLCWT